MTHERSILNDLYKSRICLSSQLGQLAKKISRSLRSFIGINIKLYLNVKESTWEKALVTIFWEHVLNPGSTHLIASPKTSGVYVREDPLLTDITVRWLCYYWIGQCFIVGISRSKHYRFRNIFINWDGLVICNGSSDISELWPGNSINSCDSYNCTSVNF